MCRDLLLGAQPSNFLYTLIEYAQSFKVYIAAQVPYVYKEEKEKRKKKKNKKKKRKEKEKEKKKKKKRKKKKKKKKKKKSKLVKNYKRDIIKKQKYIRQY